MVIFGWFLVFTNAFFGASFLTNAASVIPDLAATGADQQAAIMLAARNLGQALILAFALLYKNVRVLQMVWLMAIVREVLDLIGARQWPQPGHHYRGFGHRNRRVYLSGLNRFGPDFQTCFWGRTH